MLQCKIYAGTFWKVWLALHRIYFYRINATIGAWCLFSIMLRLIPGDKS
jgi:hypothetical protein